MYGLIVVPLTETDSIHNSGKFSGISTDSKQVFILSSGAKNACLKLSRLGLSPIFIHVYECPIPHKPCPDSYSLCGLSDDIITGNTV